MTGVQVAVAVLIVAVAAVWVHQQFSVRTTVDENPGSITTAANGSSAGAP